MPKQPSPENKSSLSPQEMSEIQKERLKSDSDLVKGGAEYVFDESGKGSLEITPEQMEEIRKEMKIDLIEIDLQRDLYSADSLIEKIQNILQQEIDIKELDTKIQQLEELKAKAEALQVKTQSFDKSKQDLEATQQKIQDKIDNLPFTLEQIKAAKSTLEFLKNDLAKIGELSDEEKEVVLKKLFQENKEQDFVSSKIAEIKKNLLMKAKQMETKENWDTAGQAYEALGEKEKAQAMWQKEAEKEEANKNWRYAAKVYEKTGQSDKAQAMWQKEAEKKEANEDWDDAAIAYEKLGQSNKAQAMWQKQKKKAEAGGASWSVVAKAYEALGEKEKAQEVWAKFAEQLRHDVEGTWDLEEVAKAWEKAGEKEKAREVWVKIAQDREAWLKNPKNPEDRKYWSSVAKAWEKAGEKEKAREVWVKELEVAMEKERTGLEWEYIAQAYEALGEKEKAQEVWLRGYNNDVGANIRALEIMQGNKVDEVIKYLKELESEKE